MPFGSELEPLERRIGYRFKDRGMLEHALTHRSRVHEDASGGVFDNESMEFLGDSVLGFVIAAMLFREFPQHNEGQKSKLKASLVSAAALARLGERLGLGEFLILGRGEEKTGGRRKHAIIADCYEALIAAIYLDGGIEPAEKFIAREFAALIEEARRTGAGASFTDDWKSALQEYLQSRRPRPARLPPRRRGRTRSPQELRRRSDGRRGGGRAGRGPEQEGSRAAGGPRGARAALGLEAAWLDGWAEALRALGQRRRVPVMSLEPCHAISRKPQSISMMPQFFSRSRAAVPPASASAGSAWGRRAWT